MLRSNGDLENCSIGATDGVVGLVKDLYFDDHEWVVRYFVVETGMWLASRKVLISPIAVGLPDWQAKVIPVSISKEQVRNGPDIDTAKPVSRLHEMLYLTYYDFPYYWEGGALWGAGACPNQLSVKRGHQGAAAQYRRDEDAHRRAELAAAAEAHLHADHHLRSCNAVMKYQVHAVDGDIGHLEGLLVDDETWAIRSIVIQTGHWWHGHRVVIPPQQIDRVSWPDATVFVAVTRGALMNAATYAAVPEGETSRTPRSEPLDR